MEPVDINKLLTDIKIIKKEKKLEYDRQYRYDRKNTVECPCGGHYVLYKKYSHIKTDKHKIYFKQLSKQPKLI